MSPRRSSKSTKAMGLLQALETSDKGRFLSILSSKPDLDLKDGLEVFNLIKQEKEYFKVSHGAIHAAAILGNLGLLKALFEEGVEMKYRGSIPFSLCIAIQNENYDIARFFIKSGAIVNQPFNEKLPLGFALESEKCPVEIVKDIIEAGFPVDGVVQFITGKTALHAAVNINNIGIVKYLLSVSANTDVKDKRGLTPLHYAVQKDYRPLVKLLVTAGATVDCECLEHFTPMCYAIATGNYEMVKLLVTLGADIHYVSGSKKCSMMPLHFAANFNRLKILQLLLELGADVNRVVPITGEIALHSATRAEIQNNQTKVSLDCIVELLIREGSIIDHKHKFGWTPLVSAIKSKNFSIAKILIANGASLNMTLKESTDRFYSPVHVVASTFDKELIKQCLDYGGDYLKKNHEGIYPCQTMLVSVIVDTIAHSSDCHNSLHGKHTSSEHDSTFKLFWKYGFPYDLTMEVDWIKPSMDAYPTKLAAAVKNQKMLFNGLKALNAKMIRQAIVQGAEVKSVSKEQPYPLHYIATRGDEKILKEFVTRGVPVNTLNKNGETPLYLAAKGGHVNCCRVILENGAVYNYPTKRKTPLEVAKANNHTEVVTLLTTIDKYFKELKKNNMKKLKPDMKIYHAVLNCCHRDGKTLLGRAIHLGHGEIASRLIKFRSTKFLPTN